MSEKIALFDIGNTNTHVGLGTVRKVAKHIDIPTRDWATGAGWRKVAAFFRREEVTGAVICSVVPEATPRVFKSIRSGWKFDPLMLNHRTLLGVGIDYPNPQTIGPDRLSNALAVHVLYGAPALVVDFGTAVTFDVVNRKGNYVGGIIAPGLAAMTDYLHEKTALLPRIKIQEVNAVIGKNTQEAMLIGAVHGYRGLVRELITRLKTELKAPRLPIIATGGYAGLMAKGLPEIRKVDPLLTLEGLRIHWHIHDQATHHEHDCPCCS